MKMVKEIGTSSDPLAPHITDTLKVETGIAVPPRRRKSPWRDFAQEMPVTGSVLLPDEKTAQSLMMAMRSLNYEYVSRTVTQGVRVWRTK